MEGLREGAQRRRPNARLAARGRRAAGRPHAPSHCVAPNNGRGSDRGIASPHREAHLRDSDLAPVTHRREPSPDGAKEGSEVRDLCDRKKRGWVVEAGGGRGECWGRGKDCESFLLNRILCTCNLPLVLEPCTPLCRKHSPRAPPSASPPSSRDTLAPSLAAKMGKSMRRHKKGKAAKKVRVSAGEQRVGFQGGGSCSA